MFACEVSAGFPILTIQEASLLGLEEEVVDAMTINQEMTEELWVRSRTRIEGTGICQGQHFSRWFKRSNCVELAVDIANATDESRIVENRKNICKRSIFTSSEYPTGTPIEYQLLFDEKDDSISNGD